MTTGTGHVTRGGGYFYNYFPPILFLLLPREYSSDVNVQVSHKAIQAIGHIALGLSARANICVDKLLSLLALDIDYITSETLVAITSKSITPL